MAKRNSKLGRVEVLEFLKSGRKLNALVAQREFGCVGSTLAFFIYQLRQEGWDILTKIKKGHKGSRYAEYTLSPDWRLVSEEEKRMAIAISNLETKMKPKAFTLNDFKVGDVIEVNFSDDPVTVLGVLCKGGPVVGPFGKFIADQDLVIVESVGALVANVTLDVIVRKVNK